MSDKKIKFAPGMQEYFSRFNLNSFDDFFNYYDHLHNGQETASIKSKSDVQVMKLPDQDGERTFFLKRFYFPGVKNILKCIYNFKKPITFGQVEWINANLLLENEIGTYKPVCVGYVNKLRKSQKSFIITEQLEATSMIEYAVLKWPNLKAGQQEDIIIALAKTIRKIHKLNISMHDLYMKHIYIHEDTPLESPRFSFIDLEQMTPGVISPFHKAKNLGRLLYSMSEDYFSQEIKDLLLETYLKDLGSFKHNLIRNFALKREKIMKKRKKLLDYRLYLK